MPTADDRQAILLASIDRITNCEWEPPAPGMAFGTYRLETFIDSGGYAEVWAARHAVTNASAAVKIFTPRPFLPAYKRHAALRFCNGASAMADLRDCPKVVRILEGPEFTEHHLWFAMELYETDLKKLTAAGNIKIDTLCHIFDDILTAIERAHKASTVHRDIRPSNILLKRSQPDSDYEYDAVLADFDIAYHQNWIIEKEDTRTTLGPWNILPYDVQRLSHAVDAWQDTRGDLSQTNTNHRERRDKAEQDLRTAMRRPSNDLFQLSLLLFNLTCKHVALPPQPPTKRAYKKLLDAEPLPRDIKQRLLQVFVGGLGAEEEQRFRDMGQLRRAWHGKGPESLLAVFAVSWLLLLTSVSLALFFDYLWGLSPDSWTRPLSSIASLAVTGLSALGLFAWIQGHAKGVLPTWRAQISRAAIQHRNKSLTLLTAATLAPLAVYQATSLNTRRHQYWAEYGHGCRVHGPDSTMLLHINQNTLTQIEVPSGGWLACPAPQAKDVQIHRRTRVARGFPVRELQPPPAPPPAPPPPAPSPVASMPPQPKRLQPEAPPTERAITEQLLLRVQDTRFREIIDASVAAWPSHRQTATARLIYPLTVPELQTIVDLQDRAASVANGEHNARKAPRDFLANKWATLTGHLAATAMKCRKAVSYLRPSIRHNGINNTTIWIGDALRCIGDATQYDAIRDSLTSSPLEPAELRRFENALAWLALAQDPELVRKGLRIRAFLLLELLDAEWADQRLDVIKRIVSTSVDCEEIVALVEPIRRRLNSSDSAALTQTLAHRVATESQLSPICRTALSSLAPSGLVDAGIDSVVAAPAAPVDGGDDAPVYGAGGSDAGGCGCGATGANDTASHGCDAALVLLISALLRRRGNTRLRTAG
ncbi:MAG: protein kinase [Myxococcales bacterium]|nr:protein kinase [Myxococcales bacterium]